MNKQKDEKSQHSKCFDFNSVILSGKPSSIESAQFNQQDYTSRVKQIRALRKFEQLFKKQYDKVDVKNQQNNNKVVIDEDSKRHSPHQLCNRLRGMFFLRKKAEIQNKYRQYSESDDNDEEDDIHPPIEGKTMSPTRQKQAKSKNVTQVKPLNFVNCSPGSLKKFMQSTITPSQRPRTQLQLSFYSHKVFNTQTLHSLVLGANKVKIIGIRSPVFSYFSVYVEQGNNSQLIKTAVRKRSGWKVVQMPAVANMVWSQFYRKTLDLKIKSKRDTERSQQLMKTKFQTFTNLSLAISDVTAPKSKKIDKEIQKNPNLLTMEDYNREVKKICPRQEHLHRKSVAQLSASSNLYFYNHIPNNHFITDKKNLLRNMKMLYESRGKNIFQVIPFSLSLSTVMDVSQINALLPKNIDPSGYWIVKPGENSNRGRGIVVCKGLDSAVIEINSRLRKNQNQNERTELPEAGSKQNIEEIKTRKESHTAILQQYIQPLLYFKRKFDIRMYLLVTNVGNKIRGYVYEEGYLRTSSKIFTMETFNKFVHLTNDAIQTKSPDYGKFQQGNKVSWKRFQKWMEDEGHSDFWPLFVQDYKNICRNILQSVRYPFKKKHSKYCSQNLLSEQKRLSLNEDINRQFTDESNKIYFQVFGLDFLIDQNLKLWLIQVNTNPAITTDCSRVVNSIVPKMIDNAFAIAVEPLLQIATNRIDTTKLENNFEVIYDDEWVG